eukprot:3799610-Heterocapsa_arctica.AAC.1
MTSDAVCSARAPGLARSSSSCASRSAGTYGQGTYLTQSPLVPTLAQAFVKLSQADFRKLDMSN